MLPFHESGSDGQKPTRLLLFNLPFEEDIASYQKPSFEPYLGGDETEESNTNTYSNSQFKKQKKQDKKTAT